MNVNRDYNRRIPTSRCIQGLLFEGGVKGRVNGTPNGESGPSRNFNCCHKTELHVANRWHNEPLGANRN